MQGYVLFFSDAGRSVWLFGRPEAALEVFESFALSRYSTSLDLWLAKRPRYRHSHSQSTFDETDITENSCNVAELPMLEFLGNETCATT